MNELGDVFKFRVGLRPITQLLLSTHSLNNIKQRIHLLFWYMSI